MEEAASVLEEEVFEGSTQSLIEEAASLLEEEVFDPFIAGEKASKILLHEELRLGFCFKLCKSCSLKGLGWLKETRYCQSCKKLKFSLSFLDSIDELMRDSLEDSEELRKYMKDLKNLRVSIVQNLILASKNTKFELEVPNWYNDLLEMKLDVEGEQNGVIGSLYLEMSLLFLRKSNFTESLKFCELAQTIYSYPKFFESQNIKSTPLSPLRYPYEFYLSQRLFYIISYIWNPTKTPPPPNPFDHLLKIYMRSDWVNIEFAFVDVLGPQTLSENILEAMLDKTVGEGGFRIPILLKRAKVFWRIWAPAIQLSRYLEIMNSFDLIDYLPEQSFIDLLEDLIGVLTGDMQMEELKNTLIKWLNSIPHLPPGHRARLELMVGRLMLMNNETCIEGGLYLDCAQSNFLASYGENSPFLKLVNDQRENAVAKELIEFLTAPI